MLLTNKQTNKQTDSNMLPTPTDRVKVGKKEKVLGYSTSEVTIKY